jgi:hypothetical protein
VIHTWTIYAVIGKMGLTDPERSRGLSVIRRRIVVGSEEEVGGLNPCWLRDRSRDRFVTLLVATGVLA